MNAATLKIPVFVTHRKESGYRLRCLFLPQIHAGAPRYETALNKLRQVVVQHFRGTQMDRSTLDERLWLGFAPELRFELVPLGFDSGRRWVEGMFATAQFSVAGRRYACLPQLDGIVADLGEQHLDKAARTERLVARIQAYFREQRKEQGDGFDPHRCLAAPNDELAELELSMHLAQGRFPFQNPFDLRARLHDDSVGDGASEMARVAVDLNELYPDGLSSAFLRDEAARELEASIYRPDRGAVVLVGPRGAGKTALVHGALRRYIASHPGRDRARLQKIWQLDPLRVISGMSVIGQWQRRMAVVLKYLQSRLPEGFGIDHPDHLYCDNLVALLSVGRSSQNTLTLADVLRPQLEKRAFTMVGEATPEAWQKIQQRDRRFADLFRVIRVEAPARELAIRIVGWRRAELEQQHGCRIDAAALAELLKLERRFAGEEVLPGSAVRVLDRLAVRHAGRQVGRDEVLSAYTAAYHFREKLFSRHVGLAPAEAHAHFAARLIGQPQARAELVDVVALVKSGLAPPGKPLSSLLFIGPTGVGKSEAAKLLADFLFEDEGGLVRFDMNEYVDAGALDRLIGDAARPDGQLTAAVRQRRACVLLLDEIEKAHPAVHDLLLQVLGEGRLTDALGRTTDFSQCVVVLTSNLGAAAAQRHTGFARQAADVQHTYREAVERFFRPEFLNRIDQVVTFTPLAAGDIEAIARLQLERVLSRDGFVRRLSFLNVSEDGLEQLAHLGHDETLGARALKRAIERTLTGLVAQRLASSHTDRPMLLDVTVEQGRLATRATLLDYAAPRPVALPPDSASASGYDSLSRQAEALHERLHAGLDTAPDPATVLALRAIQVRLDPLRDTLARITWELAEHRVPALRTARPRQPRPRDWRELGRPVTDMLFAQHDIHDFFEQLHTAAHPVRGAESELVRWQLELALLARRADCLQQHGLERVEIEIVTLQRGAVPAVVDTAWADYAALLAQLDLHELPAARPGTRCFEGAGLRSAFAGECGIHLWYMGDQRPVPVAVRLLPITAENLRPPPPTEIVRLRLEPARAGDQRRLTDLRSGWVRKFSGPLSEEDWRLLLWNGGSPDRPV
ncbi:AAA family ATPase [Aquabacterium sp. A7-Y]|uniref:AAA family ATPase n=1 Tax=Aquabacterium sp. A7-Y TaxID=1349605 RepID=UPI00223CB557|nr:AAA family ATPase [Aquabacterium sp. A7-Y]MCW7538708.1 AAA family ATPase [Aquabacterium sp. A7-Y]